MKRPRLPCVHIQLMVAPGGTLRRILTARNATEPRAAWIGHLRARHGQERHSMRSLARWGAQIAVRCGFRANRLATGVHRQSCCARKSVDLGPAVLAVVLRLRGHDTGRAGRESAVRRGLRPRLVRSPEIGPIPTGTNRGRRMRLDFAKLRSEPFL